jgi:RNA polymerase sigma-70 factor (ECF subfamily)
MSGASRASDAFQRLDDAELVTLAGQGEVRALEVLYDRYARAAFAFAVRIVGDPLEAEEILQEVFLRVWQQANRFQHARGSFASWLLSITHNLAIDALRRRQRRPQQADKLDFMDVLRSEVDTAVDLEEAVVVAELRRQVQAAMAQLPARQREVLELAYFQGLTQREIAELLDEPLGTVKTRMRLGLQKLQEALQAQRPEAAGR